MSERFTFPTDAPERFAQDCAELRDLIVHSPQAHLALLRALESNRGRLTFRTSTDWGEEQFAAALAKGLQKAADEGRLTRGHLLRLAHDPELFDQLVMRVFAEGDESYWLADLPSQPPIDQVDAMAASFTARVREVMISMKVEDRQPPEIHSEELHQSFVGSWTSWTEMVIYEVEVDILREAVLTLRWQGYVWGKLKVRAPGVGPISVLAKTGLFLAAPIPPTLHLRAAAATEADTAQTAPLLRVEGTRSGLVLTIQILM